MRFIGASNFDHSTQPKIGVLLANLGTPDAPTAKALRPYLKQFLWDPRVVEVPRLLWWMILHAFILTTRPKKSAEAYAEVWTDRGSPLLYHLEDQVSGVAERLTKQWGDNVVVKGAMRYGQPSIGSQIQALFEEGVQQLVVLPLYPQFGGPTTASTFRVDPERRANRLSDSTKPPADHCIVASCYPSVVGVLAVRRLGLNPRRSDRKDHRPLQHIAVRHHRLSALRHRARL